jgi:hypothetical protein
MNIKKILNIISFGIIFIFVIAPYNNVVNNNEEVDNTDFMLRLNKSSLIKSFAIQTVFLARENILFLEEWMSYHYSIGCRQFYMYDNSGSVTLDLNNSVQVNGLNKYGINIIEITKNLSNEDIEKLMTKLFEKYPVTYIRWEPKDSKGNIQYNQTDAIIDCINKFKDKEDWITFIDIDEFIVLKKGLTMLNILNLCKENDIGKIVLFQKKYRDRFLEYMEHEPKTKKFLVKKISRCTPNYNTSTWAYKNIMNPKNVSRIENIHFMYTNLKTLKAQPELLRFNHYNVNDKQLEWMKQNLHYLGNNVTSKDVHLNYIDMNEDTTLTD